MMKTETLIEPRVALVMDGSRRHYDVAKALQQRSGLERMFADWYAPAYSPERFIAFLVGSIRPNLGQRMRERVCGEIPLDRVRRNPLLAIRAMTSRRAFQQIQDFYGWYSNLTADWILRNDWGRATAVFGFIRNIHPRLCQAARRKGLCVIGEQMIAPFAIEQAELERQHEQWPGWEPLEDLQSIDRGRAFEEQTWSEVDRIVAPSEYVRQALKNQGVQETKIDLIPYPATADRFHFVDRGQRQGPVVVGFVGQINLRKNIPVILEVAKRFSPQQVQFRAVGRSYLTDWANARLAQHVSLVGVRPRSEIPRLLSEFDIFFFPSTCEGSAGSVIEAMATGLPQVVTPNSGAPVVDGREGYVGSPMDVDFFADKIEELAKNQELRLHMGRQSFECISRLTLANYGAQLIESIQKCSL